MNTMVNEKDINELLSRGVGDFIDPENSFKNKLLGKINGTYTKPIVIKFGVDPTRPDLHLGHAVVLRKLRKLQEIGCHVVFLIGDITAQIGDPTGKSKVRPEISQEEIKKNMDTYLAQVGKLLITDNGAVFSWITNSDWFLDVADLIVPQQINYTVTDSKTGVKNEVPFPANSIYAKAAVFDSTRMQKTHLNKQELQQVTLRNFLATLRKITHARLIARDLFQDRLKSGEELFMHEMMYPVLQGLDSNLIGNIYGSCDLEVGGTDQLFNMVMGRDTMKIAELQPQSVLSFKLLEGLDGKEKMSKSLNNYIAVTDEPSDMYGKVMSIPDSSLVNYFELTTFTPLDEIETIKKELAKGEINPKDYKMQLAKQIVAIYHGQDAADKAQDDFNNTFKKGGVPEDIEKVEVSAGTLLVDILVGNEIVSSKTEWRRLVDEGAVQNMDIETKITDYLYKVEGDANYKIGKRRFIKIIIK
jgi:tyrosyl-tRNA synthetase